MSNTVIYGNPIFYDAVSLLEGRLSSNRAASADRISNDEKEAVALRVLKCLLGNLREKQDGFLEDDFSNRLEQWMTCGVHFHQEWDGRPIQNQSTDVLVTVVSRFGCEAQFMAFILEQREQILDLIKAVCHSLARWDNVEKSATFVIKCLDVLLRGTHFLKSFEMMHKLQDLWLTSLSSIMKENCKIKSHLVKELMHVYQRELGSCCLVIKETGNEKESFDGQFLLRDSFDLITKELDSNEDNKSTNKKTVELRRKIAEKLQEISETENSQRGKIFNFLSEKGKEDDRKTFLHSERLQLLCSGIELFDQICMKLLVKDKEGCYLQDTEMENALRDWKSIADAVKSLNTTDERNLPVIISILRNSDDIVATQSFVELIDGWELSAANCLQKYPEFASLYGPVTCTVEFLVQLYSRLSKCFLNMGTNQGQKQEFEQLSQVTCKIILNVDIETAQEVMLACFGIFQLENFNLFNSEFPKEAFDKELNLAINKLSLGSSKECFDYLAYLCLTSPFDVLAELMSRGATSAPLSKLVICFLNSLSSLLILQKKGNQLQEIIFTLKRNCMSSKRENFKILADLVDGLLCIKSEKVDKRLANLLGPWDVLSNIVMIELEKHRTNIKEAVPLPLLLMINEKSVNYVDLHTCDCFSEGLLIALTNCSLEMVRINEAFQVTPQNNLRNFCQMAKEREQLHVTILATLKLLKQLCTTEDLSGKVYIIISDELPNLKQSSRFYFANLLMNLDCIPDVSFPIPHQLRTLSSGFSKLKFQEFPEGNDLPNGTLLMITRVCQINFEISCHFLEQLFKTERPNLKDILAAFSISMIESTMHGWDNVVILMERLIANSRPGLLVTLGLKNLASASESIRNFACKVSLIIHASLTIVKKFAQLNDLVIFDAVQTVHYTLLGMLSTLKASNQCDAVTCLAILYVSCATFSDKFHSSLKVDFDALMLQVLETMTQKLAKQHQEFELEFWNDKLASLKTQLSNE